LIAKVTDKKRTKRKQKRQSDPWQHFRIIYIISVAAKTDLCMKAQPEPQTAITIFQHYQTPYFHTFL
jgi:hypothetical protein